MYISDPQYNFSESKSKPSSDKKKDKGKVGLIRKSDRDGKKFMVLTPEGKIVHFGAKGYSINVGRDGGKDGSASDSYCSRSAGIKDSGKYSANAMSRRLWNCKGTKAMPGKTLGIGDTIKF